MTVEKLLTIYAIGSAITHTWQGLHWLADKLNAERNAIIKKHVYDDHRLPLKICTEDECINLKMGEVSLIRTD
jgi:hypothetical protein